MSPCQGECREFEPRIPLKCLVSQGYKYRNNLPCETIMSDIDTNKYNLTMWQGATFGLAITVKDANNAVMNLSSYTARMQIRSSYSSGSATESLTTTNGEITISAATGNVALELAAARTANISVDMNNGKPPRSTYVYDLELIDGAGKVSKLLYGDVLVYGEVTR